MQRLPGAPGLFTTFSADTPDVERFAQWYFPSLCQRNFYLYRTLYPIVKKTLKSQFTSEQIAQALWD
jgi:hypothetical protein